jgi:acetyltransferase-like isoleucine patch superfamily enzyme
MDITGADNQVRTGANVRVEGEIIGDDNVVDIGDAQEDSTLTLSIRGDGNHVRIGNSVQLKGLRIRVGTHVAADATRLTIADGFSVEWNTQFLLPNSGNALTIGANCMFSNSIVIRCGESPHLLFDLETGQYLDTSSRTVVGDHVWMGEGVYVTKRAAIASEIIVGAFSVVTGQFTEEHVVIAGNPARVTRKGVRWIRNPSLLTPGSPEHDSYHAHMRGHAKLNAVDPA